MHPLEIAARNRILILDGAMGTMIQQHKLTEADYRGAEFAHWESDLKGNNDLLVLTQPGIISGIHEPSGLLPFQMPLNMKTVEEQDEDVPRDMNCYTDTEGHTYDFAYGLDWSGVISDIRVSKYK